VRRREDVARDRQSNDWNAIAATIRVSDCRPRTSFLASRFKPGCPKRARMARAEVELKVDETLVFCVCGCCLGDARRQTSPAAGLMCRCQLATIARRFEPHAAAIEALSGMTATATNESQRGRAKIDTGSGTNKIKIQSARNKTRLIKL